MDVKGLLEKYKIKPDPLKDQFFLEDEETIKAMIDLAELTKKDVVLEVGAGIGNLTGEIAKKAKKVIAFEIDKQFLPFLTKLSRNVEVHYENAWSYVQGHGKWKQKRKFNKVISNPPYSFIEQFLHNLTFLEYDKVIFLVPLKFIRTIEENPIFSSFFKPELKFIVAKEKFYPEPRTNSAVINLLKLPDAIKTKNLGLFLRQYMYQHEEQKTKNSLMEGLIKFAKIAYGKSLTKNQAREILKKSKIDKDLLEIPPADEIYLKSSIINLEGGEKNGRI